MAQNIKTMVRTITTQNYAEVDAEVSMVSRVNGWNLFSTHFAKWNQKENGYDMIYVFTKDAEPMVAAPKRGRPPLEIPATA